MAMVLGAFLMGLIALVIGNMTAMLVRLKEKVDSFDRASQVFLLLHQEIKQADQDFGGSFFSEKTLQVRLDSPMKLFYPVTHSLQLLTQPPDFFPITTPGPGQYAGGVLLWSVHFLAPLRGVSGKKGENFLAYTPLQHFSYGSPALDKEDVIGVKEGKNLQIFQITRVSSSGIFLNNPLIFNVNNGQAGLISNGLWYLGYAGAEKASAGKIPRRPTALYRYDSRNHLREKMVSEINGFGVGFGVEEKNPHKISVQVGKTHYVF